MQNRVLRSSLLGINVLIFFGTIILNLLAIVYILTQRDQTTISTLVVNLAIADIIHATGIIFFSSNLFTRSWIFGEFGCKFSLSVDVLCTVVIVYTVAALSIERYIDARAILTAKFRAYIIIGTLIFIWGLGFLLSLPFILFTFLDRSDITVTQLNTTLNKTMYSCESELSEKQLLVHEIVLYIVAFLIPYSIIVTFSLKLLHFLRQWLTRKQKLTKTSTARKRTRGVKLVLCIVLSFLICYTPFWAFKFYTRYVAHDNLNQRQVLRRILSYLHSLVVILNHFEGVLNPLFFILLTEKFCLAFSKHRERHSKLFGGATSVLFASNTPKKITGSSTPASRFTVQATEAHGLLLSNNHQLEQDEDLVELGQPV